MKLVYENRGEKLGIAQLDLNDRIAAAIEQAELDPDQEALLEKLLGQDYEVVTATTVSTSRPRFRRTLHHSLGVRQVHDRLHRQGHLRADVQRIEPRWKARLLTTEALSSREGSRTRRGHGRGRAGKSTRAFEQLRGQAQWMETRSSRSSSASPERSPRLQEWGFDIIPHRVVMKNGFETPDGKRLNVEDAFKDPQHPFRVAIVCAMWLTGFDVECLQTLYIDKPMKAHTLMQAIARANRIYPGKDCGVIVDYNGMLKSLRAALAEYALGDEATAAKAAKRRSNGGVCCGAGRSNRGGGETSPRPWLRTHTGSLARPALPASLRCAMPWMRSTRRTKRSAGSRSWRGRFSPVEDPDFGAARSPTLSPRQRRGHLQEAR